MQEKQLYLNIINNLQDGVYFVDTDRIIQFWNKAAESITGYTAADIIGKQCQNSRLNHIDEQGRPLCSIGCPLFSTIVDGQQRAANVFVRHKTGYRIPITVNIFPVYGNDNETIIGAAEVFTKNSPKHYEDDLIEKLSGVAMHDTLTVLPNRRYLESFLEYKLSDYTRFNRSFAVLFSDIDNFRDFNNKYGHDVGDTVLCNVANSLKNSIRSTDLVGRWGGEELLGIYTLSKDSEAAIIGEKYRSLVANTEIIHEGQSLSVSVSVGITVACKDDTIESIIKRADLLMYQSKKNGKNCVTVG
jgi:PAS domain S-box/diguanylate cyclase (GGDEF) domain